MSFDASIWRRAQDCIVQGTLTNSKHPESLVLGAYPTHIDRGHGSHLIVDGENLKETKYLDYICGLGTNILGYGNNHVTNAIMDRLKGGFSHSLPTTLEVEVAEKLREVFPFTQTWKFLKTGSEACSAAIKFARAFTGSDLVLSEGYHGWHDEFVSLTEPAKGVPKRKCIDPLLDLDQIDEKIAAVIVEPIITDWSRNRIEWLKELEHRCNEYGTILIFDEVITGFRWPKYSFSAYSNITPDIIIIGKAMANGMPLAAIGGKRHILNDRKCFVSSTYAGEVLSLAACKATCEVLQKNYDYRIDYLWDRGKSFIDQFNSQTSTIKIEGYPTRGVFKGDETEIAIFFAEMAKAKVLFCKSFFYNFGHIPFNDEILNLCREVKEKIASGSLELKFPLPKTPFAQEVRNDK